MIRLTLAAAIVLLSLPANAQDDPPSLSPDSSHWVSSFTAGVQILSRPTNTTADGIISFSGGIQEEFFFSRNVGFFLGADYVRRGFSGSLGSTSTGFIDLPFGFSFNLGRSILSGQGRSTTQLGGYYAIALGDYAGDDLFAGAEPNAENFFGLGLKTTHLFEVSPSFAWGFSLWFKWGLGNSTDYAISTRFVDMGLGLTAAIF